MTSASGELPASELQQYYNDGIDKCEKCRTRKAIEVYETKLVMAQEKIARSEDEVKECNDTLERLRKHLGECK